MSIQHLRTLSSYILLEHATRGPRDLGLNDAGIPMGGDMWRAVLGPLTTRNVVMDVRRRPSDSVTHGETPQVREAPVRGPYKPGKLAAVRALLLAMAEDDDLVERLTAS